jgi:iron complex transport system ATP-binding protein
VFHDLNLARRFGDTALVMTDGTTAACGTVEKALNRETLHKVYGIDIHAFMLESLEGWKVTG